MNTKMVFAAVIGVLTLVIGFNFIGPLYQANDKFYRALNTHCVLAGGATSLRIHSIANPTTQLDLIQTAGASTCSAPLATGNAVTDWQTEDRSQAGLSAVNGEAAVASTVLVGSSWKPRPALFNQFGNINNLLAQLVPLLIILGFIGIIGANLFTTARSESGSLIKAIGMEVLMLVLLMVAVNLATPFLDGVITASSYNNGILVSTIQFSDITSIVFALLPLAYALAVLGLISWRGKMAFNNVQAMRGNQSGMQKGLASIT